MAAAEGVEDTASPALLSPAPSPRGRVKFLCSHGGKILPRPPDGQLKYVGGETRVVAVPRDINLSDLMKKLSSMSDGDKILKYQVIPEDLDTLVSVRCEEDLQNMLSEHDRQDMKSPESSGSPKLRAFLFPVNPTAGESQLSPNTRDNHTLELRYIDAINGFLRPPIKLRPISLRRARSTSTSRPSFTISSAGSSPKSITQEVNSFETVDEEGFLPNANHNYFSKEIPKVNSSPNLYNLGQQNPYNVPHQHQQHQHHYQQQVYYPSSRMSPVVLSPTDFGRCQLGVGAPLPPSGSLGRRSNRGSGECPGCGHGDGCQVYRSGGGVEMVVGFPQHGSMGS